MKIIFLLMMAKIQSSYTEERKGIIATQDKKHTYNKGV
jgi:hypothetical protein